MIYSRSEGEVAFRCINFITEQIGFIGDIASEDNVDGAVLYKTTDGGFNWNPIELPDPVPDGLCGLFSLDSNHIFGAGRYYGSPTFIKSSDGGENWESASLSSIAKGLVDLYFFNADTGLIAGSTGQSSSYGTVFRTTDGGDSWQPVITTSTEGISLWKISFPSSSTGYISFQSGGTEMSLLKTTDSGENWMEIIYDLPNFFSAQGMGFVNDSVGWVGGFPGFPETYITIDGGFTWQEDNYGKYINRFRFINDTLAYAAGETVYKYSITPVTQVIENYNVQPDKFFLSQNYPNPFNPSTIIKYEIPEATKVGLKVYDILGREVATLVDEYKKPGRYEVEFRRGLIYQTLASGVYIYQLKANEFVQTKKMILVQ